jgi:hypothetical protein
MSCVCTRHPLPQGARRDTHAGDVRQPPERDRLEPVPAVHRRRDRGDGGAARAGTRAHDAAGHGPRAGDRAARRPLWVSSDLAHRPADRRHQQPGDWARRHTADPGCGRPRRRGRPGGHHAGRAGDRGACLHRRHGPPLRCEPDAEWWSVGRDGGHPVANGQHGDVALARRLPPAVRAGAGDRAPPLGAALSGRDPGLRAGPPDEPPGRLPATRPASREPDRDRRGVLRACGGLGSVSSWARRRPGGGSAAVPGASFSSGASAQGRSSACRCCSRCPHLPPSPSWRLGG